MASALIINYIRDHYLIDEGKPEWRFRNGRGLNHALFLSLGELAPRGGTEITEMIRSDFTLRFCSTTGRHYADYQTNGQERTTSPRSPPAAATACAPRSASGKRRTTP